MSKKLLFTALSLFLISMLNAQDRVTSLFGFSLGQFAEAGPNELGRPLQVDEDSDGYSQEIYVLKAPDSVFVVLEQYKETQTITSIQVTTSNHAVPVTFKGLSIGADRKTVEKALGKASAITPLEDGYELLDYEGANYSIEMKDGKLFSIKIWEPEDNETPQADKLPVFKDIVKILQKGSNSDIAAILMPDMEMYKGDETVFFKRSMKTEIEKDSSGIFSTLKEASGSLDMINTSDLNQYEENMRLVYGEDPMHVVKIKNGHKINEIAFKYYLGQWRVWEITIKE